MVRIDTRIHIHYSDDIMGAMTSQFTSLTIVYSTVYLGADKRKHQSSASLPFVRGIHRWPHNGPVTQKMFPFDDVTMQLYWLTLPKIFFELPLLGPFSISYLESSNLVSHLASSSNPSEFFVCSCLRNFQNRSVAWLFHVERALFLPQSEDIPRH